MSCPPFVCWSVKSSIAIATISSNPLLKFIEEVHTQLLQNGHCLVVECATFSKKSPYSEQAILTVWHAYTKLTLTIGCIINFECP